MPYMRYYKILCNYQVADITLIHSINYTIGLFFSFLYNTNHYSTVFGSFYKFGLICLDLFWLLKLQIYITLYAEI